MRGVIVAHGQPSEPGPPDRLMQALAERTAAFCDGIELRGCTLARPGALEAAAAGADRLLVYPFFMAEGWFTQKELPRRLRAAGATQTNQLRPFGADPGLAELMEHAAGDAGRLLLAGHGSQRSTRSADTLEALARKMRATRPEREIVTGYIEQAPHLEDSARALGGGVCLPFFALGGEHVADDIPEALEAAGFEGTLLPQIGQHPETPEVIARALNRAMALTV